MTTPTEDAHRAANLPDTAVTDSRMAQKIAIWGQAIRRTPMARVYVLRAARTLRIAATGVSNHPPKPATDSPTVILIVNGGCPTSGKRLAVIIESLAPTLGAGVAIAPTNSSIAVGCRC